jgi:hypothetical protein
VSDRRKKLQDEGVIKSITPSERKSQTGKKGDGLGFSRHHVSYVMLAPTGSTNTTFFFVPSSQVMESTHVAAPDMRLIANRSLSHTEPVSGTSKRKLKNGEQRPPPKTRQLGTASVNFPDQRLWRAC